MQNLVRIPENHRRLTQNSNSLNLSERHVACSKKLLNLNQVITTLRSCFTKLPNEEIDQ